MTDINLLPPNQRQKELTERETAFKEKQKIRINLTDPVLGYKKQADLVRIKPKRKNILKIIGSILKGKKTEHELKSEKVLKLVAMEKKTLTRPDFRRDQGRQETNQLGKSEIHLMPVDVKEKRISDININLSDKKNEALSSERQKEDEKKIIHKNPETEKENKISYTTGSEVERGIDVNLIPGGTKKTFVVSTKIKILSLVLILVAISLLVFAVYLWFGNQIKTQMNFIDSFKQQNDQLKLNIEQLKQNIKPAVNLQYQLFKLDKVMGEHVYFSKLFDYLEKNTVEGVYYSEINFNGLKENTVVLKVIAIDYLKAAEQILIFKDDTDNIIDSEITLISKEKEKLEEGKEEKDARQLIEFSIQLKLKDDFFYNK